jgi:hypothetical protein
MTGPSPANPAAAPRDDLTPRVFRALYRAFDLHTVGGTHIAVPAGTPVLRRPQPERGRPPDQRPRAP